MAETRVHVELLACTPNPEALIYAAFRQCYHKGFVGEMWPRLLSGDIPKAQQAEYQARDRLSFTRFLALGIEYRPYSGLRPGVALADSGRDRTSRIA